MVDPYRNYKWEVEIAGFTRAGFSKVTGLKDTTEIIEYNETGNNETPQKLPGQTKFENLVLERGVSFDEDFQAWRKQVFDADKVSGNQGDNESFRKDVTLYLKDKSGKRRVKWKVKRAWPSEKAIGDLDAKANDVLMETLTLAHEGLTETKLN